MVNKYINGGGRWK